MTEPSTVEARRDNCSIVGAKERFYKAGQSIERRLVETDTTSGLRL